MERGPEGAVGRPARSVMVALNGESLARSWPGLNEQRTSRDVEGEELEWKWREQIGGCMCGSGAWGESWPGTGAAGV